MTESEWLAATDPAVMLESLRGTDRASDRKLRLFACACYHRVSHLLPDHRARAAVEVAERVADGTLPVGELEGAMARIREPFEAVEPEWRASRGAEREALLPTYAALALGLVALLRGAQQAASYASSNAYLAFESLDNPGAEVNDARRGVSRRAEESAQADILRDVFGPLPFRPVPFDPSWRSEDAALLARQMYEARDFSGMPVLADALQEAGCDSEDVLNHCRNPVVHVRGCHVVDLVLDLE